MRHKEWKMGTMVERIQPVGPSNLLNNMVKVFASTGNTLPPGNLRTIKATRDTEGEGVDGAMMVDDAHPIAKKKERKPLFASFSSRGKARGRDLQAPDCLLLEPGYESSRQGSSSAGIGELDTNNNTSNKAWIQRLFRFPQ